MEIISARIYGILELKLLQAEHSQSCQSITQANPGSDYQLAPHTTAPTSVNSRFTLAQDSPASSLEYSSPTRLEATTKWGSAG